MDMRKLVGRNFGKLRREKGFTQEQFAEISGFTQQYVSDLERGRRNPTVVTLFHLADALGMSLVETIGHARHAYFDSAVMLLFFLLCGRYLDRAMRRKTRAVAGNLAALRAETAHRIAGDGEVTEVDGLTGLTVAAGQRLSVVVDGVPEGTPLVVTTDQPVVVERRLVFDGDVSSAIAVPVAGSLSEPGA